MKVRLSIAARWSLRADEARDGRRWAEAVRRYQMYLRLNPSDHERRVQLGHAFKELGRLEPAERCYLKALKAMPESADLNLQLGHLYKVREEFDRARAHYQRAAALDPDLSDAVAELVAFGESVSEVPRASAGDAARDKGQWIEAVRAYEAYLEREPGDGPIWEQLGHARRERRDLHGALQAYQRALELQPQAIEPRRHRAHVAKALGMHADAVAGFVSALLADPQDGESFQELVALGERERALDALHRCAPRARLKGGYPPHKEVAIFTIASNNYLPMAETLLEGVAAAYPDAERFLCLADRRTDPQLPLPTGAEVLLASEIGIPGFDAFAFRYGPTEFHTALKPFAFEYLLRERGYRKVIYLDPDIQVFAPSGGILAPLDAGASFVLTPHFRRALPFRRMPDTQGILRAGAFNLGFIAANCSAEALEILRWWSMRLLDDCRAEPENGWFVDQRFVDLFPAFAPNLSVCRSPVANLAYWNLEEGRLSEDADGFSFNGLPLEFFHFSGFDPRNPNILSKYLSDNRVSRSSPVGRLLDQYAQTLISRGYEQALASPLTFDHFPDGRKIPQLLRRFFRECYPGWWENPFLTFETEAFQQDALEGSFLEVPRLAAYMWRKAGSRLDQYETATAQAVAFRDWLIRQPAVTPADSLLLENLARRVRQQDSRH